MPIKFSADRWEKVKSDARLWWQGKLGRPLIHMPSGGIDPGRPEPRLKGLNFDTMFDLSVPAADIVDRWDYELSTLEFHGDSFPCVWPNFGPGVIAAYIGGVAKPARDTVWFYPPHDMELADLRMRHDAKNALFQRVKDIYRAAVERWEGQVQLGMTDLGGNLDILSTFRPGEQLLMDLYDHPEEVKRQTWEAHRLWWQHFDELDSILRPVNPGYTAWAQIFSEEPSYMLQCDFCYMISPAMFDEFVKPELEASCKRLTNAFYHLDGIGELPHLDSLLSIKELKGIQWIPGDGRPGMTSWPEVYRKIHEAGKLIQIWGDLKTVDALVSQIGSADGLVCFAWGDPRKESEAREFLRKYGGA
jgi:5-methyltetrahydrofolate--homocysteine methyltransferase